MRTTNKIIKAVAKACSKVQELERAIKDAQDQEEANEIENERKWGE